MMFIAKEEFAASKAVRLMELAALSRSCDF